MEFNLTSAYGKISLKWCINLQNDDVGLSHSKANYDKVCTICNKIISEKDLVHVLDPDDASTTVHFRCYIEIQEKLCSECGKPFKDQERLFYCEKHYEYFHTTDLCLQKHLEKHMNFQIAFYDAIKNRIIKIESSERETVRKKIY